MTPTTTALLLTYFTIGLPFAWIYLVDISTQNYETSDPWLHLAGTIALLIMWTLWIIFVPGWMMNKSVVKN